MRQGRSNQKGAALLTVLVAMMIIFIMLFEFQYNTMVERKLAYNDLNQLQAYYLAKAGVRIGLLRVSLYGKAKKSKDVQNLVKGAGDQYLDLIWNLRLPPFPPPRAALSDLETADKNAAEAILKQTKVSDGSYSHTVLTEGAKINLNQLILPANRLDDRIDFTAPPQVMYQYVGRMLVNLIESFLRESENPTDEYGDIRPEEVVMDIMDWVNAGPNRFAGGAKDPWYEQQNPPYKAKRHKFYTLEELRMVRGISDKLFNKLKPHVTVYSEDGRINLNTIGENMHKAIYGAFTEDDIRRILEERTQRGGWAKETDFVEFVSSSLNRPDFKTYYPTPQDYPFTVAGRAFVIESMGQLNKSGSAIQKLLRVAVALSNTKGGQRLPWLKSEAECNKAGKLWFSEAFQCFEIPTSQTECSQIPGASWEPVNSQNCCRPLRNKAPVCPKTATGTTGTAVPEADHMKILYWSES